MIDNSFLAFARSIKDKKQAALKAGNKKRAAGLAKIPPFGRCAACGAPLTLICGRYLEELEEWIRATQPGGTQRRTETR